MEVDEKGQQGDGETREGRNDIKTKRETKANRAPDHKTPTLSSPYETPWGTLTRDGPCPVQVDKEVS